MFREGAISALDLNTLQFNSLSSQHHKQSKKKKVHERAKRRNCCKSADPYFDTSHHEGQVITMREQSVLLHVVTMQMLCDCQQLAKADRLSADIVHDTD